MSEQPASSRRDFLKAAAVGAGVSFVPSRVRGANDLINVGVIGVGGRGTSLLREVLRIGQEERTVNVVAVCDVYRKRVSDALELAADATGYDHYKELLNHDGLDVVVIATPPHWHCRMAIDAMEAGKDVYLEKPMAQELDDARDVAEIMRRSGQVLQVGSQTTSQDHWHQVSEIIQSGVIGKLIMVQGSHHRNSVREMWDRPMDDGAGPDGTGDNYINWKEWLGPTKKMDWDRDRGRDRFFRFRKYWEYSSGGVAGDLLYHNIAPVTIALGGRKAPWPFRVSGMGGTSIFKDAETSDIFTIVADYAEGFQLVFSCSILNDVHVPGLVRGHEGTINMVPHGVFERPVSEFSLYPEPLFKDGFREKCEAAGLAGRWEEGFVNEMAYGRRSPVPKLTITAGKRETHMQNFLGCVRSREKPVLDAFTGYKVQTIISMAVKSFVEGKTIYFDARKGKMLGKPPKQKLYS